MSKILGTTAPAMDLKTTDKPLTPLQRAYMMQNESIFFRNLPPEIRIKIYQYLLHAYEVVNPSHQSLRSEPRMCHDRAPGLDAGITRTCRAAVYETYPILYGQNVFSFAEREDMQYFQFKGLNPSDTFGTNLLAGSAGRFSLLRHVSLYVPIIETIFWLVPGNLTDNLVGCWRELEIHGHWDFPALEHLYLDMNLDLSGGDDGDVSLMVRNEEKSLANIWKQVQSFILDRRPRMRIASRVSNLRKITIKHVVREPLFVAALKKHLRPGVEVVVETGLRSPIERNWCWSLGS